MTTQQTALIIAGIALLSLIVFGIYKAVRFTHEMMKQHNEATRGHLNDKDDEDKK